MRYRIKRQAQNRLHLILERGRLTQEEADILYYALIERRDVVRASVYVRTGEVSVQFRNDPEELLIELEKIGEVRRISRDNRMLREKMVGDYMLESRNDRVNHFEGVGDNATAELALCGFVLDFVVKVFNVHG